MKRLILLVLLAGILAMPCVAIADEPESGIMWASMNVTKPGKGFEFAQATVKNDGPMYDELLANGTLTSWGIAIPINHRPEDNWNYMVWASMNDWSGVGNLQAGFQKMFESRSEDESKAMKELYEGSVVAGSHFDWIVRETVNIFDEEAAASSRYFGMSYFRAQPGGASKVTEFYKKSVAPIFEKLKNDGVITGYGMFEPELHTDPSWTHVSWYSITNTGAVDKVSKALDAGIKPEDAGPIREVMDPMAHWDQILLIVHMGANAAEGK